MKVHFIFLVIALWLNYSCRKKDIPQKQYHSTDTILPLPYLPVYPGSYWKFITSDNKTVTYTTSPTYVQDSYVITGYNYKFESATYWVPLYNGMKIWGYRSHSGPLLWEDRPLITVVNDSLPIGTSWTVSRSGSHNSVIAKIIRKDDSVKIGASIFYPSIVIQYHAEGYSSPQIPFSRSYYVKNIGLVKTEDLHWSSPDSVLSEMTIIDYHINR